MFLVFVVYIGATGGITDGSERFFMEADIDIMGGKVILKEGVIGRDMVEEWVV